MREKGKLYHIVRKSLRRERCIALIAILFVALNCLMYFRYGETLRELDTSIIKLKHMKDTKFLGQEAIDSYGEYKGIEKHKRIDTHARSYDDIFENLNVAEVMKKATMSQRCDLYFTNLFLKDKSWSLNPTSIEPYLDNYDVNYNSFVSNKKDEIRDKLAMIKGIELDKVNEKELEREIKLQYDLAVQHNMDMEQLVTDEITHFRIFNKCYLDYNGGVKRPGPEEYQHEQRTFIEDLERKGFSDASLKDAKIDNKLSIKSFDDGCSALETRIYRWLAKSDPVYERFNGEVLHKPPRMRLYLSDPEVFEKTHEDRNATVVESKIVDSSKCYLRKFRESLNGKGLVLSIANLHVQDTVRLLRLLRALGNKYPIQVVYLDDLDRLSIDTLVKAAREDYYYVPDSYESVKHLFPNRYLEADHGFPKQEIWFVNVHDAIKNEYKVKYEKFGNKFIAAMFNSFEEYILLDADTVLLEPPLFFFNSQGYKDTGALFFRDRTAAEFRPPSDGPFFSKLTPSIIDQVMFDIPTATNYSLDRGLFDGMFHYMESGLVVMDHKMHFNSILAMMQFNLYRHITIRLYGDKELFWLAFTINGDENYYFNKLPAAALGVETPLEENQKSDGSPKRAREVCSAHPAHIDGNDEKSLLWFNSGCRFCGRYEVVDYEKEFNAKRRLKFLQSVDEMKSYYKSPLIVKHAVIPPFKDKWLMVRENYEEEPLQPWSMASDYCNQYLWCAASTIGGMYNDGENTTLVGKFIEFDQDTVNKAQYFGDIWIGQE